MNTDAHGLPHPDPTAQSIGPTHDQNTESSDPAGHHVTDHLLQPIPDLSEGVADSTGTVHLPDCKESDSDSILPKGETHASLDCHLDKDKHILSHSLDVSVHADGGRAGAFLAKIEGLDNDGTLSIVGVKHCLGHDGVGDWIEVSLKDNLQLECHIRAPITHIHDADDSFRAQIDSQYLHNIAGAISENLGIQPTFRIDVPVGEEVAFKQLEGVPHPVMRYGRVSGEGDETGSLKSLAGTEGPPGSSGSLVFNQAGQAVGQVVAYDPEHHVNLMATAEQILKDLSDFANGNNLADHASPVFYDGRIAPVVGYKGTAT